MNIGIRHSFSCSMHNYRMTSLSLKTVAPHISVSGIQISRGLLKLSLSQSHQYFIQAVYEAQKNHGVPSSQDFFQAATTLLPRVNCNIRSEYILGNALEIPIEKYFSVLVQKIKDGIITVPIAQMNATHDRKHVVELCFFPPSLNQYTVNALQLAQNVADTFSVEHHPQKRLNFIESIIEDFEFIGNHSSRMKNNQRVALTARLEKFANQLGKKTNQPEFKFSADDHKFFESMGFERH
jgi:hypothetical protein